MKEGTSSRSTAGAPLPTGSMGSGGGAIGGGQTAAGDPAREKETGPALVRGGGTAVLSKGASRRTVTSALYDRGALHSPR